MSAAKVTELPRQKMFRVRLKHCIQSNEYIVRARGYDEAAEKALARDADCVCQPLLPVEVVAVEPWGDESTLVL